MHNQCYVTNLIFYKNYLSLEQQAGYEHYYFFWLYSLEKQFKLVILQMEPVLFDITEFKQNIVLIFL